jgi:hypothetical protein
MFTTKINYYSADVKIVVVRYIFLNYFNIFRVKFVISLVGKSVQDNRMVFYLYG